ncbi:lutropin-choriogonadotropic hormone receptor-like [Ornithodoros turicata]|uniref:lutropin-choriogonadotropic hormone receptor-like n=1 Tax=Ornithodoros turicata TaxID=34597 RepID=UPI0031398D07
MLIPTVLKALMLVNLRLPPSAATDEELPVPFSESAAIEGCQCWAHGSDCRCFGDTITEIPQDLGDHVEKLTLEKVALEKLRNGSLDRYSSLLRALHLNSLLRLHTIEPGAFDRSLALREISIQKSILLKSIPQGVLNGLPKLSILRITHSGLLQVPYMHDLNPVTYIGMLNQTLSGALCHLQLSNSRDFDSNRIQELPPSSIKVKAGTLILNHNVISIIHPRAFEGSRIAEVRLRGNRKLTEVDGEAFVGLSNLSHLDLSETSLNSLPTLGLEALEELDLRDTPTLQEFPSVYHFKLIKVAQLTYPFHCCAFQFPETHSPQEHHRFQKSCTEDSLLHAHDRNVEEGVGLLPGYFQFGEALSDAHIPWGEANATTGLGRSNRTARKASPDFGPIRAPSELQIGSRERPMQELQGIEGTFHPEVHPQEEQWITCGKLASRQVHCFPAPDAFNPCEDVMGTQLLRVAVWFVVVAAVTGNLAVMLVLISGRMSVSKFLMCNLAFADLCMGAYLLLIAAVDLHTSGQYFNHAILWQSGSGCKIAGFLTVFASELSIYTLTVITLERWYAITYAVHLNRRLKLRNAIRIMAFGWLYACLAAALPLLGISSYKKTSICLPMENRKMADLIYLIALLSVNGLAFLLICACYGKMYQAITGQRPRSHSGNKDTSVAKRMALLVFTDFACWAPVAFFGLTAVAGYPLIDVPKSKILLVFFYPLNSCANPFLYAILTKQYRRDLSMLLSKHGVCTGRMLKYTSSCHTTPSNRLLRGKENSSTSRQTTEVSGRKGSPHPIKNNFTKIGLREELLRRQSLLCEHLDTPI